MSLRRFRRQYEQLSQFERERIIGMMEAGWSTRRVARQLCRSDCVVRRCWDQCIREISFTRIPGSGRPRQTSRRETRYIIRNARLQPTASPAAIQAHVAPSLGAPVSSRTIRSHESRFNLSSDDNPVRVWRPRSERLNPAFPVQRHTALTAGVMVWGAIAYNTRSPLVLIRGTMTAQRYVHDILQPHVLRLMQRLPGAIFQLDNARPHTARVSKDCLRTVTTLPSLPFPILSFVSNQAYLESFGTASWASHEFDRTRGKVTANIERNVSRHHTEFVCLNS
ncbi:transposable element Tcb2 transposase [Trichonephila clavipes]|nr:transposable element Tcb2 transposase [Trichonephila clavipes]